jgi:hypothetical protein
MGGHFDPELTGLFYRILQFEDKSVIFLSERLDAILLSTDKISRNYAKSKCVDCHGMLWILDKLIQEMQLKPDEAILKINELIDKNLIYRNNNELQGEVNRRIKNWSKK